MSEARFAALVAAETARAGVTAKKMFGALALCVDTKVYCCFYKGHLVVKVAADKVAALIATGDGVRFDPGMGRTMKEWAQIAADSPAPWQPLVDEARAFVGGRGGP